MIMTEITITKENIYEMYNLSKDLVSIRFEYIYPDTLPDLSNCVNLTHLYMNNTRCIKISVPKSSSKSYSYGKSYQTEFIEELPDLSKCVKLKVFECCSNYNLIKIPDLSNCVNLEVLNFNNSSIIKSIDLSNCINLTHLYINNIYTKYSNFSELFDLSNCVNLKVFECHSIGSSRDTFRNTIGHLETLPELSNCVQLEKLICFNN
jgi:hypothetical protein